MVKVCLREKNYFGVRVRMRACVPACLRACELACVFVCTCFLYLGRFTERGAVGFGGSAGGTAHGRAAHSLAFRAIFHLAHFLGAAHRARRLFTVHFALGAFVRFAVHLTVGARAHRVALGGADGVVAEPFALGVRTARGVGGCGDASGNEGHGDEEGSHNRSHFW